MLKSSAYTFIIPFEERQRRSRREIEFPRATVSHVEGGKKGAGEVRWEREGGEDLTALTQSGYYLSNLAGEHL